MNEDSRSKAGYKPRVVDNANDTFEALGIANKLDGTIQDIVNNPNKYPKLFEKIVDLRLKSGKQKDPREEFTSMSFDDLAKRVCRTGISLHPDYRTLEGIKEHLSLMNVPCPLQKEGQLEAKKNSGDGSSTRTT